MIRTMFCEKDHLVIENAQNEIMQMFLLPHLRVVQALLILRQSKVNLLSFLCIFSVLNEQKFTKA